MGRIYDIELSCGCLISSESKSLISCGKANDCKFDEECEEPIKHKEFTEHLCYSCHKQLTLDDYEIPIYRDECVFMCRDCIKQFTIRNIRGIEYDN